MQRVEAHAVNQFRRAIDVPDGEIAAFAEFQRADIATPYCACRMNGDGGEAFLDGQTKQGRTHIHGQEQRGR